MSTTVPPARQAAATIDAGTIDACTIDAERERIDAIDADILGLLELRRAASQRIQQARVDAGGPRIQHGREHLILARYSEALGPDGGRVGLAVLDLCRGAGAARPQHPLPAGRRATGHGGTQLPNAAVGR